MANHLGSVRVAKCLLCANSFESFMSFGRMPIANGFLEPHQFKDEFFFELEVGRCPACGMTQLANLVEPGQLFHENYAYFSSISRRMSKHFEDFAGFVIRDYVQPSGFVVEIGSNDGILLKHFAAAGISHLGIEPSRNVAEAALAAGVNTVCRFFDEELAREVRAQYGPADALLGANVVCHIPDLHSILAAALILLKERGVFIFEDPYLGDIVAKTAYDQIYDEHVFYFSVASLANVVSQHGLEIVDALPQSTHGGSMRYVLAGAGVRPVSPRVAQQLAWEEAHGLQNDETYAALAERIHESRDRLRDLLSDLRRAGKRVSGYGATSKSTTVTNFCGITPDLVEFISDTTPGKQGKFSPGVHIPVVPYERFRERYPDYAVLFAWNHGEEILEKERDFRRAGGKFIQYVPVVSEVA